MINVLQSLQDFIAKLGFSQGSAEHDAASKFADFLTEEQQNIQDAITLLTDHGYTVTHDALPDAVAAPSEPVAPTTDAPTATTN
jgi:ABC-type Zn2+ transport system substrate-binding protein/surface adhesin